MGMCQDMASDAIFFSASKSSLNGETEHLTWRDHLPRCQHHIRQGTRYNAPQPQGDVLVFSAAPVFHLWSTDFDGKAGQLVDF